MNRTVSVVVVDDERPLVDLVSRYLRREGYEVHPAYDGDEAIDVIARVDPDVVVLDPPRAGQGCRRITAGDRAARPCGRSNGAQEARRPCEGQVGRRQCRP